jgi:hypothetical protein
MRMFAYLDPGSGSILLQTLIGGVAGVLVLARYCLKSVFPFIRSKGDNENPSR